MMSSVLFCFLKPVILCDLFLQIQFIFFLVGLQTPTINSFHGTNQASYTFKDVSCAVAGLNSYTTLPSLNTPPPKTPHTHPSDFFQVST